MSGIAGTWFTDGRPADRASLGRMLDSIAHRGPDGSSVWCDGGVGLGHRMLRSTPESRYETLPVFDAARGLAITADARIDNREELIRALGLPGRPDRPHPDSALILAAYDRWGEGGVERLVGDFAFAIWDSRRQRLFCARDQVGVKPFYYHHTPGGAFVFASELKALLQLQEVPRRLNETRLADYLLLVHLDAEYTFFQDIQRLPPGHCLVMDRDGRRLRSYWSPDPSRDLRLSSDEAYTEAFLEVFTEAVRCRLRSADPVALTLSGGMDSSSIACIARDLLRGTPQGPLLTFSTVFEPGSEFDETPYIQAVLQGGGCQAQLVAQEHAEHRPVSGMRDIFRYLDEPVLAPNAVQSWRLFEWIRQSPARVVLDGHGGDETVSHGHGYLAELAKARQWRKLLPELRGVAAAGSDSFLSLLLIHLLFGYEPVARRSRVTRRAWKAASRLVYRTNRNRAFDPTSQLATFDPDFARRTGVSERYRQWRQSRQFQSERQAHWRTITGSAQPAALEFLDVKASAASLELRFPFWDRRLVEFCLMLPPEQKRSRGWGRMILRRAMDGILPPQIQWRRDKVNFLPNVLSAVRGNEMPEIDSLRRNPGRLEGFVKVDEFRDACDRIEAGTSTMEDFYTLSKVATLYYWFETGNGRLLT